MLQSRVVLTELHALRLIGMTKRSVGLLSLHEQAGGRWGQPQILRLNGACACGNEGVIPIRSLLFRKT